ncbi:hypothetical protein CF336_g8485 [Tilletia laevis]|nr:hypothetical protein CF336_g8485 [Tilletia laevis]
MSSNEQATGSSHQRADSSASGTPEAQASQLDIANFGSWFGSLSVEDKARVASMAMSSPEGTGPVDNATGQAATTTAGSALPPRTHSGLGVPPLSAFVAPPPGPHGSAVSFNPWVKAEPVHQDPYPAYTERQHGPETSSDPHYVRGPFANQHRAVGDIPKLCGRKNWFSWKTLFFFSIRPVNGAIEHLTNTIPSDQYSYSFDIHLGELLVRTMALDQLGPVMMLMSTGEMRGSKLYESIRKPFERTDAATRGQIESTLTVLKQRSHTAAELNQTLTHLFAQALNAGVFLDEERKIHFLCKSLHPKYGPFNGQINAMARRGLVPTYEVAIEDLYVEEGRLWQEDAESRKVDRSAQAFAVALYGGAPQQNSGGQQGSKKQAFKGKCYRCQKVGHKRYNCPNPAADGEASASNSQ